MSIEHFRFSTEMLRRLGEELNPHPDQGVLELVRNAYDADASTCTVSSSRPIVPAARFVSLMTGTGWVRTRSARGGWSSESPRRRPQAEGEGPAARREQGHRAAFGLEARARRVAYDAPEGRVGDGVQESHKLGHV